MHTAKVGCASGSTMPTAATMQQQATPQHGPARPLQAVATTAAARPSPATCLRPDVESIYSTSAVAEPVPPFPGQQPPLTQDVPMYENTVEDDFVERFLKLDNVQLNQLRLEAHQHPVVQHIHGWNSPWCYGLWQPSRFWRGSYLLWRPWETGRWPSLVSWMVGPTWHWQATGSITECIHVRGPNLAAQLGYSTKAPAGAE